MDAIVVTEVDPLDDPGPKMLYVNKAFTDITGYTAEESLGNSPRMLQGDEATDYVDLDSVRKEVAFARKLYTRHGWPVLDVTRRSIEETAASILTHLARHQSGLPNA